MADAEFDLSRVAASVVVLFGILVAAAHLLPFLTAVLLAIVPPLLILWFIVMVLRGILRQLLPWNDSSANRARGAWIHVAPAINGDVRSWFERSGWTQPSDWPRIADAILRLVRTCVSAPEDLARACSEFTSQS